MQRSSLTPVKLTMAQLSLNMMRTANVCWRSQVTHCTNSKMLSSQVGTKLGLWTGMWTGLLTRFWTQLDSNSVLELLFKEDFECWIVQ